MRRRLVWHIQKVFYLWASRLNGSIEMENIGFKTFFVWVFSITPLKLNLGWLFTYHFLVFLNLPLENETRNRELAARLIKRNLRFERNEKFNNNLILECS